MNFSHGRVVDDPFGLITCAKFWIHKPSPMVSRGSGQDFLDVINRWRPVTVGDVEDGVLSVLCMV